MNEKLLIEIEKFMSETGLGPHRFGILAASNGRLVDRLREGRRVWPETEAQVRAFMISHRRTSASKPTTKAKVRQSA